MSVSKVASNESFKVHGFKVMGIRLPFTCKSLRTDTVIQLAGIGERIKKTEDGAYIVKDNIPLIIQYIATGLNNNRFFGLLIPLYKRELQKVSQTELIYLYNQVKALWNPALFFCLLEEMQTDSQVLLKPKQSPTEEIASTEQ